MIALLQRVSEASVRVEGEIVGEIGPGLVALWAVETGDTEKEARRLVERTLGYRVFNDGEGRMNLALKDTGGGLLMVPQFTLAADTRKGMRPSFTPAASPADGERLFAFALAEARQQHGSVASGRFGADMQVGLINDGPVTFWLSVPPANARPD